MNWDLYLRLSGLMFLEFAVWGAWMPVLALRLLGPMKMTGRQIGMIYATLPLASIFAPLASGYLADKWFNAEWIMCVSHVAGAVLLFFAARQTKFWGMFSVMLLYSIFYTATLPLVNKILFQHMPEEATKVFLWAPIAWALIGYLLTGFRQLRNLGGDGPDALYLASLLSVMMAVVCLIQPATAPNAAVNPMSEALGMLSNTNYLIFILVQLVVSGMMQFYFIGTGRFLQDRGIEGKNVSAIMGSAQAVQAVATFYLLDWLLTLPGKHGYAPLDGFQWAFVVGALCWTFLFLSYLVSRHNFFLVLAQGFHGLAYVFFMIAGISFVGKIAPSHISGSAQSLLSIATNGVGLFLGTQLAGAVMHRNTTAGKFQWSRIWAVPLAITLAGAIVFAVCFKAPSPSDFLKSQPVPQSLSATPE